MSETVVKVEHLGKKFLLGNSRSGELRETLGRQLRKVLGRVRSERQEFWALRDLNFEIKRGDVVGIVGRNGAGKSTLLKILSRITDPTTGRFEINGRVSSLLEVGTGFHSELTGRENIFLNGTILGMRRVEIKRKFDEIVAFSGVESFLDTPVKHYSSGMRVRLAFSVAAHLEPEILIIDEVLAVGDADFQKKCLGKMNEVSKKEGRTILFVSHNMAAVSQLCSRGIFLNDATLESEGETGAVIDQYLSYHRRPAVNGNMENPHRNGSGIFRVKDIQLLNNLLQEVTAVVTGSTVALQVEFDRIIDGKKGAFRIDFAIDDERDTRIGWFSTDVVACDLNIKFDKVLLRIPRFPFGAGTYYLTFYVTWNGDVADHVDQGFAFAVEDGDFFRTGKIIPRSQTYVYADHEIIAH